MKNIQALRQHLFDQLERLSKADEENIELEIKKSASVVQVCETILSSAQIECEIIKTVNSLGSQFIKAAPKIENGEENETEESNEANNEAESTGIFNPDDQQNWLINDGGSLKEGQGHAIAKGKISKAHHTELK